MYSKFPSEPVSAEQMTFSDIFDRFRYKPEMERTWTYDDYRDREDEPKPIERETPSKKPPKRSRNDDLDMEL